MISELYQIIHQAVNSLGTGPGSPSEGGATPAAAASQQSDTEATPAVGENHVVLSIPAGAGA